MPHHAHHAHHAHRAHRAHHAHHAHRAHPELAQDLVRAKGEDETEETLEDQIVGDVDMTEVRGPGSIGAQISAHLSIALCYCNTASS